MDLQLFSLLSLRKFKFKFVVRLGYIFLKCIEEMRGSVLGYV